MDFFCLLTEELLKKKTKHLIGWASETDFVLHSSEAAKIMHRKVSTQILCKPSTKKYQRVRPTASDRPEYCAVQHIGADQAVAFSIKS